MPRSYVLIDPLKKRPPVQPFGLGSKGAPVYDCARVLCGTADVEIHGASTATKLRFCHLSQQTRRLGSKTPDEIVQLLFDGDLSTSDAQSYLLKAKGNNQAFWEELRTELCFCLTAYKNEDFVSSFLYLYRIFEHASVALPLIYSSSVSDFREALKFIKSLNRNDRDMDLAVLRYFTDHIAKSSGTLGPLTFDFQLDRLGRPFTQSIANQFEAYVLSEAKIPLIYDTPTKDGASTLKIDFRNVPSFIVGCRNRLFHNAMSNSNFKSDDLGGASHVCQIITGPGIYWFSLVFCEIVKADASRYV